MTLPIIERPIFQTNILSLNNPVEFVPFTVKESKILMMAKESDNVDDIVNSINQILSNCLVDKSIKVKDLPLVDLEWLFLQIQAKSAGEKVPLYFKCTNEIDSKECGMVLEFELDLTKVFIENKDINKKIMINDKVGIMMKLPTFEMTKDIAKAADKADNKLIALCIDYVFDDKNLYYSKDASPEEMLEFVESLPLEIYNKTEEYLENCPKLKTKYDIKCSKCGYDHKIVLEGLENFFV